jgi:RecA-family ATPase
MFLDALPDGPRIGRAATPYAGMTSSAVSTDTLIECVLAGDEIHNSLRDLAMRGYSESRLRELMDQSAARTDRPSDWGKRRRDIPRLVRSAAKKLTKRAEEAFGKPSSLPMPPTETQRAPGNARLPFVTPADMAGLQVKPREWIVANLLPKGEPSLLYGAGATGKSHLLLHLCIAMAGGARWLDRDVPSGRCLMFTCEDGLDELNRRAAAILEMIGMQWSDCGDRLALIPMRGADMDAVLASSRNDGTLQPTGTYLALRELVGRFEPDLIVIDTLADTFAGEENRRADAKAFVNLLVRLRPAATIITTAHPSVSGQAEGRGTSGSTGWPAAVRSHLYLDRVRESDGRELDADVRVLRNMKANYSRQGTGEIELKWRDGAFVALDGGVNRGAFAHADADELFLRFLVAYTAQGRFVNASSGASYAPSAFASEPKAKAARLRKVDLRDAMLRLFAAGRIKNALRMVNRKERTYLAIVEGEPTPTPWLG